jgi:hypothetical protein
MIFIRFDNVSVSQLFFPVHILQHLSSVNFCHMF